MKVYEMETKKNKTRSKQVSVGALADKYGCSRTYVHQVLRQGGKSVLARKILKDASDLIAILERDTIITV